MTKIKKLMLEFYDSVMSQVRILLLGIIAVLVFDFIGCATIRTMPTLSTYGSPKIYSGTRLDLHALMENESGLKKFKVEPPKYPLLDLPFSLILDTAILPATYPVATYEFLFDRKRSQ